MRTGHSELTNRSRNRVFATAVVAVATVVLLTCSACNGFFVDPTLSSIALTPAGVTILVAGTKQYQAVGTYNDGSTKVLAPVWTSSSDATATINTSGLAKGVAAGTATITATSGGVTGTTTLTVQTAPLASITVAPANPSVSLAGNKTLTFTATGRNTDGSTSDLTSSVTWASGTLTVATISTSGVATALLAGPSLITATSGTISGSTTMTVGP